jgi:predicted permease
LQEVAALVERGLSADAEAAGDDPRPMVRPYREHMIAADARSILATMLALAGLVLLIACANVANLLLSRAFSRRRELAVRVALGASRLRVAWHQLAESAAVAVLGGLVGCLLAVGGVALARRALGHELAWWMELRLDAEVLAFAAALIGVAALLAGLLPALHAMRSDPDSELRGGARGGGDGPGLSRLSKGLVVAEVGFSAAVLIVSALMARGAFSHSFEDETREPEAVMVVAYTLPAEPADARPRLEFHHTLTDRLAARPGVESVALAGFLPGVPGPRRPVEVPGSADLDEPRSTHVVRVSPGYFDALGVSIVRGRDLTWRDGEEDPPAVVVNEAFVRRHLPQGDPLGRTVRILPPVVDEAVEAVVVGVAPQMGIVDRSDAWEDALYLPPAISPSRGAYVLTRARAGLDPHTLLPDIREVVRGLDPDRPLYDVATLAEHQRSERITEWFFTGFFGAFGLAGLLMAGAGLYAVIAFAVGRRRREVGVRVALGASPRRVLWTVGRGAGIQLGAGLVLGLGLAAVVAPAFGEALLGADPHDLAVYTLVAALIGATGLLASAVPAARALRVRPAEALRAE